MTHLKGNEGGRRHYHQQLRPALLKIDAGPFGAENHCVEEGHQPGHPQKTARDDILQPVQEVENGTAVHEHQLAIHPIRDVIEPARPAVQKEQRNPNAKEQDALRDLENRDDFQITNPPLWTQHLLDRRGAVHPDTSRRSARNLKPPGYADSRSRACSRSGPRKKMRSSRANIPARAPGPPGCKPPARLTTSARRSTSARLSAQKAIRLSLG